MLIESEPQGFGLFGRVFSWMLDLLPYCDSQGWQRADWRIYSPNYGEPPDFNIFPSVLEMVYTPDPKPAGMVSFDELHWRFNPQDGAGRHFNGDYQRFIDYVSQQVRTARERERNRTTTPPTRSRSPSAENNRRGGPKRDRPSSSSAGSDDDNWSTTSKGGTRTHRSKYPRSNSSNARNSPTARPSSGRPN